MDSMVKRRTRDFKDYLEEKIPVTMVPQEIRSGVVKAITKNLEFQTKWDSPYEEKRILSDLPPNLRFSCIEFIHGDQIPDIALFNPRGLSARDPDYQPPAGWFLSAVVEMLKPTFYLLGDHVIDVGDQPESLIFVIEGAAEELYEAERR